MKFQVISEYQPTGDQPQAIEKLAQGIINGEMRLTSELRHSFKEVKPHTAIRVEYLTPDVLVLQNEFLVTFFLNGVSIAASIVSQLQFHRGGGYNNWVDAYYFSNAVKKHFEAKITFSFLAALFKT